MNTPIPINPIIKLAVNTQELLRCPICSSKFKLDEAKFKCTNFKPHCFPVIDGIPILLNESESVFSISDYVEQKGTTLKPKSQIERLLVNLVPRLICNIKAKKNFQDFAELLLKENLNPKILIIGASVVGEGIESLLSMPEIELIESDVAFGPRVSMILDAHNIPFDDNSFDGVIVQAVLEHVTDPAHCVEEIYRVLKPDALVYSETPFIQQVHLGKYDFTRFTHLGHRRLFRKFEEISSGASCGPGMALAWSYQYFLLSFVKSPLARGLVKVFARMTAFWLKYFDYYLIDKPGTFDAASSYYFMGKKSDRILSDRELLTLYKGTQSSSF
ncbi:MAG: methyltransferase domain-containing protein [Cyanomargarita calcarea GSE-NOS-MK-12-04C]|jgi:SAM-dependent methyltransferase|uniref:Methyltransferase domain-containing protein n=1 Tax=Cyanomargarita calcarea GSE-NOS-MK-12-04C TaxID=2839659 RepID=A0A951UVE3_9CYAN|nr:methyltransferase domain-containing protein [Cyanomargarita calcarea GSE-NOS-MK-12-04C]